MFVTYSIKAIWKSKYDDDSDITLFHSSHRRVAQANAFFSKEHFKWGNNRLNGKTSWETSKVHVKVQRDTRGKCTAIICKQINYEIWTHQIIISHFLLFSSSYDRAFYKVADKLQMKRQKLESKWKTTTKRARTQKKGHTHTQQQKNANDTYLLIRDILWHCKTFYLNSCKIRNKTNYGGHVCEFIIRWCV